ncbi:MAG: type I restriction endonuclease, partial [Gammaproteobacteria bacterium]|nr:type I restriction endonuclease [Gammaproteobacteria bacterium]
AGSNGFDLIQFAPSHSFNQELKERYAKNRLRVMRQVHYSINHRNSIDLVLFVNGVPVATIELKTDFTQSIDDAKNQYKTDRPPRDPKTKQEEPLLKFKRGALVHFAVSTSEVWMTTQLNGMETFFLPFNKGYQGGKGNPPNPDGYPTAYLWEEIFQKDRWLQILESFIQLEVKTTTDKAGAKKLTEALIFPRYHQLDAVIKLIHTVKTEGVGKNYLFQHSAGSGKSNTIGWSAHQLATLHNANNQKIFDTVIVITDRTVLDEQLKDTIDQFSATKGVVISIDSDKGAKSGQLLTALTHGAMMVIVTLQTFPFILKEIRETTTLKNRNFAVIADEAHSSQTGSSASQLRKVLGGDQLAMDEEESYEDYLIRETEARALPSNISFIAFTATPKGKTLELFGRKGDNGLPLPFHLYTMKQAIQEGFILDVLQNFTPYRVAYRLAHGGKDWDSKTVDKSQAGKTIARWVRLHPYNISQKVAIMVEHFRANVMWRLHGQAKAMVVTDSRQSAVRYKIEMEKYIQSEGYDQDMAILVAFSGEVHDPEYGAYAFTETQLNKQLRGGGIREGFTHEGNKLLIVANKFQTGFDQPLLLAMYVDKRIDGITAVQTLSRLNRTYPGKELTYILDFVNDIETIRLAFEPYYEHSQLLALTNPDKVYDLSTKLDKQNIYSQQDLENFVNAYRKPHAKQKDLQSALRSPVSRFKGRFIDAEGRDDKEMMDLLTLFEKDLGNFCRLYEFMSQIVHYADTELEARYLFYRHLAPLIKPENRKLALELAGLEMTHYKMHNDPAVSIPLGLADEDEIGLKGITSVGSGKAKDPELVQLEELIKKLNELFPEISDTDRINLFRNAQSKMMENAELHKQAKANDESQFVQSPRFETEMLDCLISSMDSHRAMTTQLLNDEKLRQRFKELLAKFVFKAIRASA